MALHRFTNYHLVRNPDINLHGTLYAPRFAEWFIEAGFLNLALLVDSTHVYCQKIHGMEILHPIYSGNILRFDSFLVETGHSALVVYIRMTDARDNKKLLSEGVLTFATVDQDIKGVSHHLIVAPEGHEECAIQERARSLAHKFIYD
ncbi:MAG: acyl-CoA thioesterase [Bacteroidales bacterium]